MSAATQPNKRRESKWHFLLSDRQVCATTDTAKKVQLTPNFQRVDCRACRVIYIRRFEEYRYE